MRLAFMGTPDFSVPVLSELIAAGHEVLAVYTRAPQKSGRGHKMTPSPIHQCADAHGIEVRTPRTFKAGDEEKALRDLNLDVAVVVVAYGMILPQAVLDAPVHGCLNLHASLLPRWRGAAPIQRAIMAGDEVTGVQVMQMEAGLDTGAILLSEMVCIEADDTAATLHDRLSHVAAQLGPRALAALERGGLVATPQSEEGIVYAHKITSKEARIDWTRPAHEIDCHIRGMSPFPGAWTEINGERIKILMSRVADQNGIPGEILNDKSGVRIATGDGAVDLLTLQRAGKRRQNAEEFLRGFSLDEISVVDAAL